MERRTDGEGSGRGWKDGRGKEGKGGEREGGRDGGDKRGGKGEGEGPEGTGYGLTLGYMGWDALCVSQMKLGLIVEGDILGCLVIFVVCWFPRPLLLRSNSASRIVAYFAFLPGFLPVFV